MSRGAALRPTPASIFRFWAPLAGTWVMMAFEGPYLAAIIARLPDAKINLAAHGVALAFAILVESPVIMLMSASTALVDDAESYRKLRNFTLTLNGLVTLGMAVVLLPPVSTLVLRGLVGLPATVADRTHAALLLLIPWPGAIGYRRFYQGLLIRGGRTRLVAAGTLIRLGTMTATALALALHGGVPGAQVSAAALASGVTVEALAARFMARATVRELLALETAGAPTGYRRIVDFYAPLALTSMLGLTMDPILTFFMGRSNLPVVSLAIYPVVDAFSFLFRALGVSFQEAGIALLGDRLEHDRPVRRFALWMGGAISAVLALVAFSPLARVWYHTVAGLTPDLAAYALVPTMVMVALPALSVWQSYQRAILVQMHRTRPVTLATVVEVGGTALTFLILGRLTGWIGVTVAAAAFVVGRLSGVLALARPCAMALREREARASDTGGPLSPLDPSMGAA